MKASKNINDKISVSRNFNEDITAQLEKFFGKNFNVVYSFGCDNNGIENESILFSNKKTKETVEIEPSQAGDGTLLLKFKPPFKTKNK